MNIGIYSFYFKGRGLTTLAKDIYDNLNGVKNKVKILARPDGNHEYKEKYVTDGKDISLSDWVKKEKIKKLFILQFMDVEQEVAIIKEETKCEIIFIPMFEWIEQNHMESFMYFDNVLCPTNQTYELVTRLQENNMIRPEVKISKTFWMLESEWLKHTAKNEDDNSIKVLFDIGWGGFRDRKNTEYALLSFLEAEKTNGELHLVFKTQKPVIEYPPMIQILLGLIKHKTVIEEDLPYKEYVDMKTKCDIFLCTTGFTGLEIGPQEALSMNMPVISMNIGPMNEIINQENGFLFNPLFKSPIPNTFVFSFTPNTEELIKLLKILDKESIEHLKKNNFKKFVKKKRRAFINDLKKALK